MAFTESARVVPFQQESYGKGGVGCGVLRVNLQGLPAFGNRPFVVAVDYGLLRPVEVLFHLRG